MNAQDCIDAAALTSAERGILVASTAHTLSPWTAALLVDLETAASIAADRAAAGEPVTLLDLAETLAGWAAEPGTGDHVGTTARPQGPPPAASGRQDPLD